MSTITQIALGGTIALLAWPAFYFLRAYITPRFSPLTVVPGPDNPHWLRGHFGDIITDTNTGDSERRWLANSGHIYKFKAFFSVRLSGFLASLLAGLLQLNHSRMTAS